MSQLSPFDEDELSHQQTLRKKEMLREEPVSFRTNGKWLDGKLKFIDLFCGIAGRGRAGH